MAENGQPSNRQAPSETFFLSEIMGLRVVCDEKKLGRLADLVIVDQGKLPEVTQVYVTRPFGYAAFLFPWDKVVSMTKNELVVRVDRLEEYEADPADESILLKDHVLDKKVLDIEGREVEVVYDVKLALKDGKLWVSDVDLSRYGLLRRIGLKWLANFIYGLADKIKHQTVSWTYIQPLPTQIGSFSGDVRLKVFKEKISEMRPADLADILEEMDPEPRIRVFEGLDTSQASDALEEIEPNVQRALVSSLKKDKVARLIDEMTPAQAVDILRVLSSADADAILKLLAPENAKKIESILELQEEKILNYATQKVLKFRPDQTVDQTQDEFRRKARGLDVVMYVYVVDEHDRLLGVINIKDLLQASEEAQLKDVMVDDIITLNPDSTLRDASAVFARYGFRAIPVTDEQDRMLGVVPYRDVMSLNHRFLE